MSAPMSPERLAEIRQRRAAVTDAPWGSCRDLDGTYTVQSGALVASEGFDSSGDVAHIVADTEERGYRRAAFIARAPGDVDALLAEVRRLRAEVESLRRCASEQLETIQEAALAYAERGDELQNLRAELADRPSRTEVLREAAGWVREIATPIHDRERTEHERGQMYAARRLDERADAAGQAAPESTPTPIRWGLDDAELGDDDSVTLWLSGPAGEPYVLELDADRARALRGFIPGGERG